MSTRELAAAGACVCVLHHLVGGGGGVKSPGALTRLVSLFMLARERQRATYELARHQRAKS